MKRTYVMVADSSAARIFSSNPKFEFLDEVSSFANPQGRMRDRELESDRPGRQNGSAGEHHGVGDDKSTQRHEAAAFASELADFLEQERVAGNFQQLILSAPPQFLGDLRKQLSDGCDRLVAWEMNKEIVSEPERDILERLRQRPRPGFG